MTKNIILICILLLAIAVSVPVALADNTGGDTNATTVLNQTNVTVTATPTATLTVTDAATTAATGETANVTSTATETVTGTTVATLTVTPVSTAENTSIAYYNTHFLKPGTDLVPYNEINYPNSLHPQNLSDTLEEAYYANLTYPWNQLKSPFILLFIDPNYPKYTYGPTREQQIEFYTEQGTVVPPDQAAARFNLTNTSDRPIGYQILIDIELYPGNSTHIVDPYITSVDGRSETYHDIGAWVDVNNIASLAMLPGIKKFHFIPTFLGHSGAAVSTDHVTPGNTTTPNIPTPSPTTPKAEVSFEIPAWAAMIAGIFVILSRERMCR
jgi:hypothetical protein